MARARDQKWSAWPAWSEVAAMRTSPEGVVNAFGFAEVIAEFVVSGDVDGAVFEGAAIDNPEG